MSFFEVWTAIESCRVICLIQARLYQMIVRSVFTVSCPSCGAPLALTSTLVLRSDEPRADSLEISRFLTSFWGKMAVFDKTESLTQTRTYTQTHKISLSHTHNHCDTYTSTSSRPHKQTYLYNFTLQNSLKLAFVFWPGHSFIQYHSEMKWCQRPLWSNGTKKRL